MYKEKFIEKNFICIFQMEYVEILLFKYIFDVEQVHDIFYKIFEA